MIWTIHIFLNQEVVGNFDRTGDKTLNLQHFLTMSIGLSVEHIYYIAIAALACILGAEIAGICMLIGKLRRARSGELDLPENEYNNNGRANYAVAALSFGAVSATAELALLVLAIAAAVGAFILCLLLVVLYAKGYLLISAKTAKEAEKREQAAQRAAQEAAERAAAEAAARAAEEELAVQEVYDDDNYDGDTAAQEAVSNLIATENEEYIEEVIEKPVEEPVEEIIAETVEEIVEEIVEEEPVEEVVEEVTEAEAEVVETAVVAQAPEAPAPQTTTHTLITEGAPAYAGQAPIIEKHIIETTKEIIKETNTTTVTEGTGEKLNAATEQMLKALTELMKIETQHRMEREVPVERPIENSESTPVFAETEYEEPETDENDIEEPDFEEEPDAEDEAEREADAEENDDEYESELFGNERIVGFDPETGCHIVARYRKSCEAKLMQSRHSTKKYYSAIRNALMGYEGTKERMSWTIDTYTNDHAQIARINVRPRTLDLYLALEPSTLEDSVYRGKDVGGKKKYAETPFLYKVNSPRKLTLALELVQRACEEQGLSPIDIEEVNYEEQYPFTDTETLISRGLIREYLREEKPAATFELDPDHVPQLAEEDETVIPANANFTWEFDNDQPERVEEPLEETIEEIVEEEPIIEEPVAEEVIEEEPIVEEPVAEETPVAPGTITTTTTTHETIRTTERHYTERYYGNGSAAEVTEETRTIEVLPEPAEEPIEAETEEIAPEAVEPFVEETAEEIEEIEEIEETEAEPEESQGEAIEEEAIEEVEEETVEEVIEEEPAEEPEEEIIDDEIEEEIEETTAEQVAQIQSAVAALFGDDILEEDEPIEEEPVEETVEEIEEEILEEEEESIEEESIEETESEEEVIEEVEEIEEEVYEEEDEAEAEEEYYEEESEAVAEEEEYYEEEYHEEETEVAAEEEEYYEEESEAVAEEEEYYEEEIEEEYLDENSEEIYEDIEGEEFEESYEEEVEEIFEEVEEEEPAPAPKPVAQPASDVVLLDVCLFDDYFDNGAIVNLETLKQVGLAPEGATRLKVYASGALKGQFTVEANHFTLDAIKAIGDADGDSIMIR